MKKSIAFIALLFLICTCTKEEDVCTDPAGVVTVNIPNNQFFCFKTGAIAGNCGFATGLCCSDILFYTNNFSAATSLYDLAPAVPPFGPAPIKGTSSIASTGKATKLCDIKAVPSTGYVALMAADYEIGYVIKLADGTFARFIVKDFGKFTTGGTSSVQITYQYPFQ